MKTFFEFLTKIIKLFPTDPLASAVGNMPALVVDVLGYFNYFIPVSALATIMNAWVVGMLSAKAAMFLYKILIKKV